ncbi:MAG: PAS domain-containing sensor histidine kinase [Candidatus Hydrogenedens sp.]
MKEFLKLSKSQGKIISLFIPFIFGFGGLFISQEIMNTSNTRFITALLSIALPSFITITMLNKYKFSRREKSILIGGIILLFTSGIWIISKTSLNPYWYDNLPDEIRRFSELIGLGSFLLGILSFVIILIRREENIDELAERFKTLADHISEGYVLTNPDGIIVDVNEQFCRFIAITKNEIIGSTVANMVRLYNISAVEQNWLTRSYGISGEYEVELEVNNQKKYLWIHGTPIFDKKGKHKATLATVKDITELKVLSAKVQKHADELKTKVEEQTRKLRESEENLKKLIMTMNEGFLLIDIQHKIVMVNECFCKMIGREEEQVLGHYIYEFLESAEVIRLLPLLEMVDIEKRREIMFIRSDEKEVPTLVSVSVIPNEDLKEIRYSLVISDLSQQKKMQNELEERTIQLEKLNEELRQYGKNKDAFLSNVSHELRTPISTIQGYIEMFLSNTLGTLTEQQKNAMEVMLRNVERLLRMVNEMIEFSRIEIKGLQIKKKLFSVKELVKENTSFNNPKILAKQINLIEKYENENIYIWADKEKISQVLGILLNNAVKFTNTGGRIEIDISIDNEGFLELSVADTGIGIPPEYKEKIFEKFFQVDSSPTRKYEGTGIGLAIAKGIVESHNGKITVESVLGEGSKFTVILPNCIFYDGEKKKIEQKSNIEKILIVDNETVLFDIFQKILGKDKGDILWAKNIYESIRFVNDLEPEILLINTYEKEFENILSLLSIIEEHHLTDTATILLIIDENINISKSYLKNYSENILFIKKPFPADYLLRLIDNVKQGGEVKKIIDSDRKDKDMEKVVIIFEPESTFREFLGLMMNHYKIPCLITDSFENVLSSILRFSPINIVIDADYMEEEDFEKLEKLGEGKNKIFLISNNQLKDTIGEIGPDVDIIKKPFLFDDLMNILHLQKKIMQY